jgi:chromosome segregation ATPase
LRRVWRCAVLSWQAQLEDAKKEIAELEDRISALREELRDAQWAADAARLQRILAVREQHLERAKFHAQFIESRIANGRRTVKPIPYSELASICFNAAQRTAKVDTAETLKALGKTFSAKATADASRRLFGSDRPESGAGGTDPTSRQTRTA